MDELGRDTPCRLLMRLQYIHTHSRILQDISLSYREPYTIQIRYSYDPWPGSPDIHINIRAHYREGTHYPPPEGTLASSEA